MSLDTSDQCGSDQPSRNGDVVEDPARRENDSSDLARRLHGRRSYWNANDVFGPAARDGGVYRWGVAVSTGTSCSPLVEVLSRLACGAKVSKKRLSEVEWNVSVCHWRERITDSKPLRTIDGTLGNLWAAALPALLDRLEWDVWQGLLDSLIELHESILQQHQCASPLHLLLGGELGLTLALCLPDVESCARLLSPSLTAIQSWCQADAETISGAIASSVDARLILASLIRCKRLTSAGEVRPFDKNAWKETGESLAIWVAAMTTQGGSSALSGVSSPEVADDWAPDGLMAHAAKFDPKTLKPAIAAALGSKPTGGRLAWQVSLPEAMHHDPDAKFAVMFPEWDVRRGRIHVDYSEPEVRIEVFAGRSRALSGRWQTSIEIKGESQQPCGEWLEVCEYTDDDVHYLEIEQNWTGSVLLQRQMMLIREDRCVLLADTVLPASEFSDSDRSGPGTPAIGSIRYTSRIPLGANVSAEVEDETRELYLLSGRRRAMVLPLAAGEWRVGATSSLLAVSEDQNLTMHAQGKDRLYAPLWFDFQPRRFKRNRTWRPLTITDQLRIVGNDEAVGYRLQVGSEQWMVYRSLVENRCRAILGKHLIAEFYCSRFDSGDGMHEELITVDGGDSSDD